VSVNVISTDELVRQVEAKSVELSRGAALAPVPEFAAAPLAPCDSTELLSWMGWMTAGPPTLAAEVLRSAGLWAWVRYRWALEDEHGIVRPTADARSIRQHTRSMFSETVGVGAAGYLGCLRLVPSGSLAVVNLDDTIEPLLRSGVIRRRFGRGKKHPDYLIVRGLYSGPMELFAIECKGTVKNETTAIGQLAGGVRQVLGVESDLPLRRLVFATCLELDEKEPAVRCYAIEVKVNGRPQGGLNLAAGREAVRDAALIRALRCAGSYAAAERTREGYVADWFEPQPTFDIAGRSMVGHQAEILSAGSRLRAEVGVDLRLLRALAAPGPERGTLLESLAQDVPSQEDRRQRIETPERVQQETLMRDGLGIRFEQQGRMLGEEKFE
jgi:hypothetical protein